MKTLHISKLFPCRGRLLPLVCGVFLCGFDLTGGQCIEPEVLSPPTFKSIQVRTITETRVCNVVYHASLPTADPCVSADWSAQSLGGVPEAGMDIRFGYTLADTCNGIAFAASFVGVSISQEFVEAHPEGFRVSSDAQLPSGSGVYWTVWDLRTNAPSLSFEGTVSLGETGYRIDITFTGGTPPGPAISDLIARVDDSRLSQRQKGPLLAILEAARVSLAGANCQTAIKQLHAFQNKVRAQVRGSDATLADALIAAAQAIIDSACSD
jgi:hypothetical protein